MFRFFFLIIFSLVFVDGYTQNLDSLKQIANETNSVQNKLDLYDTIIQELLKNKPEEAKLYSDLLLTLAIKHQQTEYIYKANNYISIAYSNQSFFDEALQHYNTFLHSEYAQALPDSLHAKVLNNMALIHAKLYQFSEALQFHSQSLFIKEQLKDQRGIANSLNNIGLVYYDMANHQKALEYFLRALSIRQKQHLKLDIVSSYINIAGVYYWLKEYQAALQHYDKALELINQSPFATKQVVALEGKIETFIALKDYQQALALIPEALALATQINNDHKKAKLYKLKGEIHQQQKEPLLAQQFYQKAITLNPTSIDAGEILLYLGQLEFRKDEILNYYQRALDIGRQFDALQLQKDAHLALSNYFERSNSIHLAHQHFKYYQQFQDSIFNTTTYNKIQELQIQYEVANTQHQLEIARQEQQQQQQLLVKQRQQLWMIIVFACVVIFFIIVWVLQNKKIQKQHQLIHLQQKKHQEEKISYQQRELTTKAMVIHEKTQLLSKAVAALTPFAKYLKKDDQKNYHQILKLLTPKKDDNTWAAFEKYFIATHQNFYPSLLADHPKLTPAEKKLAALLRLNLSTKEIASLLHLSPKSVEVSRVRLRKKLALTDSSISLVQFLSQY